MPTSEIKIRPIEPRDVDAINEIFAQPQAAAQTPRLPYFINPRRLRKYHANEARLRFEAV